MLKKMLGLLIMIFVFSSLSFANKGYLIDTPTVDILDCDFCDFGFKFFSNGNLLSRANFGFLRCLNVGLSWELSRFVGKSSNGLNVAIPALQVKFKVYDGNMDYPEIAVGYDGQGCFFSRKYAGNYLQRGLGFYLVVGREFFIENLMINIGVNFNNRVCWFINSGILLYKEIVYLMAEYDNINHLPDARLNFGFRFALTECVSINYVVRDCCFWKKGYEKINDKIFNERIFKICYTIKF
ncbi:MAG: hypothetical protein LBS15_00085 [Endomicrobium sp.]|jgi:hypothetical protein|nr:hypothetical protein [Endomicrobium sp.]